MTDRYQSVNGAWPDTSDVPTPTAQEAVSAAKRLYRLVLKRSFKGKVKATSGNRNTWTKSGVLYVNPNRQSWRSLGGGWYDLVHDLSHLCHHRLYPRQKPHDGRGTHAAIEKQMIEHVVNSGWLGGKLKRPEKPKVKIDVKSVRHQRVLTKIAKWEAKQKRAQTALKKLRRQKIYYERCKAAPNNLGSDS